MRVVSRIGGHISNSQTTSANSWSYFAEQDAPMPTYGMINELELRMADRFRKADLAKKGPKERVIVSDERSWLGLPFIRDSEKRLDCF